MTRSIRRSAWVRLFILAACGGGEPLLAARGPQVWRQRGPVWGHRLAAGDGDSPPNLPLCVCGEWLLHSAGDARAPCSRERTLPVGPAWLGRPKMSSMRPRPPFWGHTMRGCQTCKCHLLVPPCYTPPVTHLWASVYLSKTGWGAPVVGMMLRSFLHPGCVSRSPVNPSPWTLSAVLA